ncbi:hypothetical protein ACPA2N_22130 [Ectopseudomonas hydrolytica]|uniref:hypothetical protein n=1 Tax=Ectopseudomonas hydrolytica TaxID=2493633 RepID=UPI003C30270E
MRNCSLVFLALAGVIGVYELYLRNHAGVPRESEVERIKLVMLPPESTLDKRCKPYHWAGLRPGLTEGERYRVGLVLGAQWRSLAKTGLTLSAVEVQVLGMAVLANWQGDEDELEA